MSSTYSQSATSATSEPWRLIKKKQDLASEARSPQKRGPKFQTIANSNTSELRAVSNLSNTSIPPMFIRHHSQVVTTAPRPGKTIDQRASASHSSQISHSSHTSSFPQETQQAPRTDEYKTLILTRERSCLKYLLNLCLSASISKCLTLRSTRKQNVRFSSPGLM